MLLRRQLPAGTCSVPAAGVGVGADFVGAGERRGIPCRSGWKLPMSPGIKLRKLGVGQGEGPGWLSWGWGVGGKVAPRPPARGARAPAAPTRSTAERCPREQRRGSTRLVAWDGEWWDLPAFRAAEGPGEGTQGLTGLQQERGGRGTGGGGKGCDGDRDTAQGHNAGTQRGDSTQGHGVGTRCRASTRGLGAGTWRSTPGRDRTRSLCLPSAGGPRVPGPGSLRSRRRVALVRWESPGCRARAKRKKPGVDPLPARRVIWQPGVRVAGSRRSEPHPWHRPRAPRKAAETPCGWGSEAQDAVSQRYKPVLRPG